MKAIMVYTLAVIFIIFIAMICAWFNMKTTYSQEEWDKIRGKYGSE